MNDRIGSVDSSPMRSAPQPHWKTITSTPYAAPMLSTLAEIAEHRRLATDVGASRAAFKDVRDDLGTQAVDGRKRCC
jgi:hypothetical protein